MKTDFCNDFQGFEWKFQFFLQIPDFFIRSGPNFCSFLNFHSLIKYDQNVLSSYLSVFAYEGTILACKETLRYPFDFCWKWLFLSKKSKKMLTLPFWFLFKMAVFVTKNIKNSKQLGKNAFKRAVLSQKTSKTQKEMKKMLALPFDFCWTWLLLSTKIKKILVVPFRFLFKVLVFVTNVLTKKSERMLTFPCYPFDLSLFWIPQVCIFPSFL